MKKGILSSFVLFSSIAIYFMPIFNHVYASDKKCGVTIDSGKSGDWPATGPCSGHIWGVSPGDGTAGITGAVDTEVSGGEVVKVRIFGTEYDLNVKVIPKKASDSKPLPKPKPQKKPKSKPVLEAPKPELKPAPKPAPKPQDPVTKVQGQKPEPSTPAEKSVSKSIELENKHVISQTDNQNEVKNKSLEEKPEVLRNQVSSNKDKNTLKTEKEIVLKDKENRNQDSSQSTAIKKQDNALQDSKTKNSSILPIIIIGAVSTLIVLSCVIYGAIYLLNEKKKKKKKKIAA